MAAGALTTSGYVISHAEAPDFKSVNITQIGGDFIDYGEETAPVLLGAAVLQLLLVAGGSFKGNLRFAWEGLETQNPNPYRKAVRGAVLPAVAITALSTAFMINDGLRTGPDHNIEAMVASIESAAGSKAAGKEVVLGLSPGTYHFMDESRVPADVIKKITVAEAQDLDPEVSDIVPFKADLTSISTPYNRRQASLVLSSANINRHPSPITPEVKPGAICELEGDHCVLKPNELIVDDNEGLAVGDTTMIHGQEFKVVALSKEAQSIINRLIVYSGMETGNENYFGFAALANSESDVEDLIYKLGLQDQLSAESAEEFIKYNREFWQQNVTPLIILMVGDILLFAGATFLAARRYEQERNKSLMASMRAMGMSKRQLAEQQAARCTLLTAKGVLPAYLAATLSQEGINSILAGFHAELKPEMLALSSASILAVQLAATAGSLASFNKKPLIEQLKQ
jgi:hypothetical protein